MAIPTQPTTTNIATEALKLYGIANPTTAEVTRAVTYGLEMVKSDLKDMGLEWGFLRKISYLPITAFHSKVQMPTDFAKPLSAQIMKCITTGTVAAGAKGVFFRCTTGTATITTNGGGTVTLDASGQTLYNFGYTPREISHGVIVYETASASALEITEDR